MKGLFKFAPVATALIATSVYAQERTIEEVVVTATKRPESLQDIPISVNAFTGEQIEEAGVKDIRDIAGQTPGLQIKSRLDEIWSYEAVLEAQKTLHAASPKEAA